MHIAPSILTANFLTLSSTIKSLEKNNIKYLHLDVMDGGFVPQITFGHKLVADIKTQTSMILDVHLMINEPEKHIDYFVDAGANIITVHSEACVHLDRIVSYIKSKKCMAGVAINPSTPLSAIEYILYQIDVLLLMSVNPGFGGQTFLPYSILKAKQAKQMIQQINPKILLEIDGGVNTNNIAMVKEAGVDIAVVGSALINEKKNLLKKIYLYLIYTFK